MNFSLDRAGRQRQASVEALTRALERSRQAGRRTGHFNAPAPIKESSNSSGGAEENQDDDGCSLTNPSKGGLDQAETTGA